LGSGDNNVVSRVFDVDGEAVSGLVLGALARGQGQQGRAQGVEVRRRCLGPVQLLGSHVAKGAHDGAARLGPHDADAAEVDDGQGAVGAQDEVVGLQVPVHDAFAVDGGQDVAGVDEEAPQALLGDGLLPGHQGPQRLTGHMGHHQGAGAGVVVGDHVHELGDAPVAQALEGRHLALKQLLGLPVFGFAEVKELEGHLGAGLAVGADERGPLAAFAGEALHLVAATPDVGGKGTPQQPTVHRRLGHQHFVVGVSGRCRRRAGGRGSG